MKYLYDTRKKLKFVNLKNPSTLQSLHETELNSGNHTLFPHDIPTSDHILPAWLKERHTYLKKHVLSHKYWLHKRH